MLTYSAKHVPWRLVLAGALLMLTAPTSQAQVQPAAAPAVSLGTCTPMPPAPPPCCPTVPPYLTPGMPGEGMPSTGMPYSTMPFPGATGTGETGMGQAGTPSFALGTPGADVGERVAVSNTTYIDSAIPQTMVRLRFSAFYDDNRPDRADFFYPKCGCFRNPGPNQDINAPGPPLLESRVDAQELATYLEFAPSERLSGFVEIPVRYINPEENANANGLSDVNFGFKYALLYDTDRVLTLQLRAFAPTGDAFKGLGTNNWNLEPAILLYKRLSDRLQLEAEVRDFIPIASADDFAGNVLRYGVGFSYLAYNSKRFRVSPVVEFVGWTVLNGKELVPQDVAAGLSQTQDAAGDTIVNAKVGVRFGFGNLSEPGLLSRSDLAISYGRALTGEVWYKDIVRVEYRMRF
jgi:hypothetical protein